MPPLIYLSAGGTGGHVFPAIALGESLIKKGIDVEFITDTRGAALLKKEPNFPLIILDLPRWKGSFKSFIYFGIRMLSSIKLLRSQFKKRKPKAVLSFGGYPCLPAMLTSMIYGYPLLLHEQNAFMGKANRFSARFSKAIGISFEKTQGIVEKDRKKVHLTGLPVRDSIQQIKQVPYEAPKHDEPFRLLVIGGSQGASFFSRIIPLALDLLEPHMKKRIQLAQQARKEHLAPLHQTYQKMGIQAEIVPFFYDIDERLKNAHLVIARSGASTVFELIASCRPAILIPLPTSTQNHQYFNAQAFVSEKGGLLLPQKGLTPEMLSNHLKTLISTHKLLEGYHENLQRKELPNALEALSSVIEKLAH